MTIDTEMDSDLHWKKHFPAEYSSVLEGIPKLLRPIWDKYDVHPIYFVSPEVLYDEKCCEILRDEAKKGAIIGAHLHPEYIEPDKIWNESISEITPQFPCYACSETVEYKKLLHLTELIEQKVGIRPVWYRAARFGADLNTMKLLIKLGYRYDSSVTPHINWKAKGGPDHGKAPEIPYEISAEDYYQEGTPLGIREYPITITGKRFGILGKLLPENWLFYNWLRPTHMTYLEQKGIIAGAAKSDRELVMMFHSMEVMIGKTPYVRTRWMQNYYLWRLERALSFAKKLGYLL